MGAIVSAVALRCGRKGETPHYDLKAANKSHILGTKSHFTPEL